MKENHIKNNTCDKNSLQNRNNLKKYKNIFEYASFVVEITTNCVLRIEKCFFT